MATTTPLASLLRSRSSLIELVVAAIGLALGVNLLAAALTAWFGQAIGWMAATGAALTVASLALIARRTIGERQVSRSFKGFLCFRRDSSDLVPVPRYRYNEELIDCTTALFSENEAPKKLWHSDPVHKTFEFDPKARTGKRRSTAAGKLIVEATEYFVLEILSTRLTDFFNSSGLDETRLKELTREDLGPVVFGNRFLDTFSRPMKERAAFVDQAMHDEDSSEHIVASFGDGVRFSRFDLVLPLDAKVKRVGEGVIEIDAPKFALTIKVNFEGFGAVLPSGFYELYVGEVDLRDVSAYQIEVETFIVFKPLALLTRDGWEYHQWLDSFLEELDRDFEMDSFLSRIDWESAVTTARVMQRAIAAGKAVPSDPRAASDA